MRGKWAAGIEPRNFTWVFRSSLAVSERPGGSTTVHRRVRRDEELLWLKNQGFTRMLSILPPMSALEPHGEFGFTVAHYPLRGEHYLDVLDACYRDLEAARLRGAVVLLHGDDVSDRVVGVIAGYLVWTGRATSSPVAIALVERLFRRSLGPDGRELLAQLPGAT